MKKENGKKFQVTQESGSVCITEMAVQEIELCGFSFNNAGGKWICFFKTVSEFFLTQMTKTLSQPYHYF